jgi:hypothetical protein
MSGPIASPATGCCLPINTFCRPRLPRSGAERAAEGAQPLEAGQVELPVRPVPRALPVLPVLRVLLVLLALRALQQGQVEAVEAAEALAGRCSRCLSRA